MHDMCRPVLCVVCSGVTCMTGQCSCSLLRCTLQRYVRVVCSVYAVSTDVWSCYGPVSMCDVQCTYSTRKLKMFLNISRD